MYRTTVERPVSGSTSMSQRCTPKPGPAAGGFTEALAMTGNNAAKGDLA